VKINDSEGMKRNERRELQLYSVLRIAVKIVEIHAFSAPWISDGKQSGVNELSLDDRKIYGRDGWAERASVGTTRD